MSLAAAPWFDRDARRPAVAVLILTAIHLVAAAVIPLSADETYYLSWSRFPAWGYYDHPPMIAWWIAGGTATFGENAFAVRLLAVLSTIPTSLALYATGRALFDREVATLSALWINATLLVGVGSISATPDPPSVMFWALATLAFALVIRTGNGAWWLAVGVAAGLGVASKLTDLFFGLGIVLALIAKPDLRRWLASPWLYAGAALAVVTFLPVLLWNAGHDWVMFGRQFGRITSGGLEPQQFPVFVFVQFLLLNPWIAMFFGLAATAWLRRDRAYPLPAMGVLLFTIVPLIAYMAIHSFHGQIQGNWLAPVFPTVALLAAAAAVAAPPKWALGRAWAFPVGVALSLIGLVAAANPGGVIPPLIDFGRIIHGWEGMTDEVEGFRRATGARWIVADYYGLVGELQYHLRPTGIPVVGVIDRARYAYAPPPDPDMMSQPLLIVAQWKLPNDIASCLRGLQKIGTADRRNGGYTIQTYTVYRADSADPRLFTEGCANE